MDWGRICPRGKSREVMGGLGDPLLIWLSQIERYGNLFCNLGCDSPVLVHGSREGSCRGWC